MWADLILSAVPRGMTLLIFNMRVLGVKYDHTSFVDQSDAEFMIIFVSLNYRNLANH